DKDKFGNDVTFLARPLPVEYLIIDITTTFPKDPQFTFSSTERFPIENRDVLGETQDFHSLSTYLSQSSSTSFLNIVSDFHLLLFLVTNEVMPLRDSIGLILEAVKTSNEDLAQTWKKSEQWATIEQLCSTVGGQPPSSLDYGAVGGPSAASSSSSAMWSCLHCTFMNQPGTELCEMCSLPRGRSEGPVTGTSEAGRSAPVLSLISMATLDCLRLRWTADERRVAERADPNAVP
ncbi:unnamed protein product, partial [Gadus morhua 'NCC']